MSARRAAGPRRLFAALAALLAGCATVGAAERVVPDPFAADYRIYDARSGSFISLEALSGFVRDVEVVLFGELHDDRVAHGLEAALFERFSAGRSGVLGMEMFERDVQEVIDHYLDGLISEGDFLREGRAWSNYDTDYRPLVEAARQRGWAVVGTNLPQRLASAVAREGLDAVAGLPPEERGWVAATIDCPEDGYWTRFLQAMFEEADSAAHAAAHTIDEEILRRTYLAQCARDETMAESIVMRLSEGPIFHVNGSFHSDYRFGIVPRILRRAPVTEIVTISAIPVEEFGAGEDLPIEENQGRADFLIFTRK